MFFDFIIVSIVLCKFVVRRWGWSLELLYFFINKFFVYFFYILCMGRYKLYLWYLVNRLYDFVRWCWCNEKCLVDCLFWVCKVLFLVFLIVLLCVVGLFSKYGWFMSWLLMVLVMLFVVLVLFVRSFCIMLLIDEFEMVLGSCIYKIIKIL